MNCLCLALGISENVFSGCGAASQGKMRGGLGCPLAPFLSTIGLHVLHIQADIKSNWLCLVHKRCPVSVWAVPEALACSRYTPQLLKERALSPPNARWALLRRGAEMSFRFGALFSALAWDKVTGQSNLPSRVRLRAAQLR